MALESGGGTTMTLQQAIKPLEQLTSQPYDVFPETELRNLLRNLTALKTEIADPEADNLPFWDAYVALAYHAIYLHRHHVADKNDRALENSICDCAKLLLNYCVHRLRRPSGTSFLSVTENVKLISGIYNLGVVYGKNEVSMLLRQLQQAKVPARVTDKTDLDHEEEKKEVKKAVHTVPPVPVVSVKNLISPIVHSVESYSDISASSSTARSGVTAKFSERYGKKIYWHLCEHKLGDRLLAVLDDLPAFSAFMETNVASINYFKAVITRASDARQLVGKVDILSLEQDIALHMSKIPLPDCCSPEKLERVCSLGISCIANTCKILTSLNVMESQSTGKDTEGENLNEARKSAMKKAECLTTIYEQLEKSVSLNNREAARNMSVVGVRYYLASVEGILMNLAQTDPAVKCTSTFCMPALYIVRHLLVFTFKLLDDLKGFELPSTETLTVPQSSQLVLSEIYTPFSRIAYLMRQHDLFNTLLKTLQVCHDQAFVRLTFPKGDSHTDALKSSGRGGLMAQKSQTDSPASSRANLSSSQDDLILGCLWEELNADPAVTDSRSGMVDAVQDGSLTESLLDTCSKILVLLDREFFESEMEIPKVLVKEFLLAKHISHLLPMMTVCSMEYVIVGDLEPHLRAVLTKYDANLDLFLHNLVTTGFVSDETLIAVLKSAGLDISQAKKSEPWPLYLPKIFLSFFGRILLKWQYEQQDETHDSPRHATLTSSVTLTIWNRVCIALQHRALKDDPDSDSQHLPQWWKNRLDFEDLNAEHLYLLLLAFQGLALMQKKAVFTQLASAFVSCTCKNKDWTEPNLLIACRILVVMEYLLHRLYEPSELLVRQVETLLFPSAIKRSTVENPIPTYDLAQKVYEIPRTGQSRRVYYFIIQADHTQADPLTLDGLATSFLFAPNKLPEYADLYQALNTLWNQLNQPGLAARADTFRQIATLNYASVLSWRLLRILPPSLSHWEILKKDNQEFPLDSIQNITAALWTTRLGNKSFKTWLKDTFVKLGLNPVQADIMLSNCADAIGFAKDVNRLRNFMEAFLAKRKSLILKRNDSVGLMAIDASPTEESAARVDGAAEGGLKTWFYDGVFVDDEYFPTIPLSLSLICFVCKTQQAFDDLSNDLVADNARLAAAAGVLVPLLLDCIIQYGQFCVSSVMNRLHERLKGGPSSYEIFRHLAFACCQSTSTSAISSANHISQGIPPLLNDVLAEWQMREAGINPIFQSWKREYQHSEAMTYDAFVNSVVTAHMVGTTNLKVGSLSGQNLSLKYTLNILICFLNELYPLLPGNHDAQLKEHFRKALLPVIMGYFASDDVDTATTILERVMGGTNFELNYLKTLGYVAYDVLKLVRSEDVSVDLDPSGLSKRCVDTLCALMDTPGGRTALAQMFSEKGYDITEVMLSITKSQFSPAYESSVLTFINRVLVDTVKSPEDKTLLLLSQSLKKIEQRSPENLRAWIERVLKNTSWKDGGEQKSVAFLESWISFIQVAEGSLSETLAEILLKALATIASPTMGISGSDYPPFAELMPIMEVLAASCKTGHEVLLTSASTWLHSCVDYLSQREVTDKLADGVLGGSLDQLLNAASVLGWYVGRILSALRHDWRRTASPDPDDLDIQDTTFLDDNDDGEESVQGEESEDDVDDAKLCTFTVTSKEFMSQHWYHCHTCGLTNGQGMCSVCAQVCHKGHDVTYSKFGSFFCDCGAQASGSREDGGCQALRKRDSLAVNSSSILMGSRAVSAFCATTGASKGCAPREMSDPKRAQEMDELNHRLQDQLDSQRETLTRLLSSLNITAVLIALMDHLTSAANGVIKSFCSSTGRSEKIIQRLKALQTIVLPRSGTATVEPNDRLLQPLVATQEGTFDNVKSNPGEFSELSVRSPSHHNTVRRRVMAVFTHGPAKYLAMAVEKSKISVYQLSHLLKQVCDRHQLPVNAAGQSGGTTKLMLPCHGNVNFTFNVSSVVVNQLREGLLIVTGAKDCVAVLMNPETGTHEMITVNVGPIDSSNFIIKAFWMPDSQTDLLVATLDSIKIFDLSRSTERPIYDLLIANGKVKDVTIAFLDNSAHVLAMSSTGQVFVQELSPVAAADMGPFFVTATLNLANSELPRVTTREEEEAGGGGLALYYSHAFQLLFLSYGQGKLFVAPLTAATADNAVVPATLIQFSKSKGDLTQGKSLWYFSESGGYPGQIFAWLQGICVPLVIAVDADGMTFQIVKPNSSKVKALDMVVTKYSSTEGSHSILASVNDDGTLKFFSLNSDASSSWLPAADIISVRNYLPKTSRVGSVASDRAAESSSSSNPVFPVDFFEDCTVLTSIEFGGDLVDVYPKSKLKSRLDQNATFIVSEKTGGFTIDVTNLDPSHVICGFRIGLGAQGVDKIPAFVKVFGRTRTFVTPRARSFDFPLTEDESVSSDGKISLYFAACEGGTMTYLDSLVVYGKSKAAFGWDEDGEPSSSSTINDATANPALLSSKSCATVTLVDTVMGRTLKALELAITIWPLDDAALRKQILDKTIDVVSSCQPLSQTCQNAKYLLFALHDFQKSLFHASKDTAIVTHAMKSLEELLLATRTAGPNAVLDSSRFLQIVCSLRPIAAKRPANLYQQLMESVNEVQLALTADVGGEELPTTVATSKATLFLEGLARVFWHIHASQPKKTTVASVVQLQEFLPLDVSIQCLVAVIHAIIITDSETIPLGVKLYNDFICSKDQAVALAAKCAILKTLRPKDSSVRFSIQSATKLLKPPADKPQRDAADEPSSSDIAPHLPDMEEGNESDDGEGEEPFPVQANDVANQNVEDMLGELQLVWQMVEPHLGAQQLDDFIENPNNLQQILAMPPDADDEAMLDLAMALNMQPDDIRHDNASSVGVASIQPQVGEESSDSNTDGEGVSDDEISNTPTETSALRPQSPSEPAGSTQGSDEGSGHSSLAGDVVMSVNQGTDPADNSLLNSALHTDLAHPGHAEVTLRKLRRAVILQLQSTIPSLNDGILAIPTMQVLFNLCTDLDPGKYEDDKNLVDTVISTVVSSLGIDRDEKHYLSKRTPESEVLILLLRFLSVIISKSASRYRKYRLNQPIPTAFTNYCASILNGTKVLDLCHYLLKLLLEKNKTETENAKKRDVSVAEVRLLKPKMLTAPPDMAPFFLKPFVKSCGHDLFQDYATLLTEMALRLPYQMKKISDSERLVPPPNFDPAWCYTLCEYMSFGPSHIDRRPPRKLLMALCGSKDKYRQVRDLHSFDFHIKEVKKLCGYRGAGQLQEKVVADLNYDNQTVIVEHLKACLEIASQRTINWQRHCQKERATLVFLIRLAICLDEPVANTILQMLLAVFGSKDKPQAVPAMEEGPVVKAVVTLLNQNLEPSLLRRFIRCFLLQAHSSAMRSLAHHFLFSYYRSSDPKYQDILIRIMWKLFEELPVYGHKATEFVDLLGYHTVKNPYLGETDWRTIIIAVIDMLKAQNHVMNSHPNARIYQQLADITGLEGYYLESDPCLVCNCPDAPTQVTKLSAIKTDAKYTSNSQLYKLTGAFVVDKIVLKVTELKRAKMVKAITVYYSNVVVDNIVELKNNMAAWKKAKSVSVAPGQVEVKIEFMLPIQATNLMIEYSEFYDNPQMTQETLQCPRCSTMVAAQPGICNNCGENVYQCLKCRSINYEHREPWMCHSCGFCKYGKFDYSVHCRPSSSGNLDPVVNEEQRKRTITLVDQLLTKSDAQYRTLQVHRNSIEGMLSALQKNEKESLVGGKASSGATAATTTLAVAAPALSNTANVNPAIQAIAYRYSVECKNVVQLMVQHIQKITACRKLLKNYDRRQNRSTPVPEAQTASPFVYGTPPSTKPRQSSCCYGCASAASQFCVRILRVIAKVKNQHYFNAYPGLVNELIENHLHRGSQDQRREVKRLINSLMQGSQSSAVEFITLLQERIASIQKFCTLNPSIAASVGNEIALLEMDNDHLETDRHWEIKLRCVVRLFLNAVQSTTPGVLECIALPCLRIILNNLKGDARGQRIEALATLQLPHKASLVRVVRWLKGDARNSFQAWTNRCPKKLLPPKNHKEVHEMYLQQKYGLRWREKLRKANELDHLHLSDDSWLKRLLFYPGSQQLRALAVELMEIFLASPSRRYYIDRFIGSLLGEVGQAGEYAAEFIGIIKQESEGENPFIFVACPGILMRVSTLINKEVERLTELENSSIQTSLAQGYALKYLTAIFGNLLKRDDIRAKNRRALIGPIFHGYLALRKLVIQRTRQVNEAEEKLLEIMESMTSGTEEETKSFMAICVDALKHGGLSDYRTPQFIYERLCTIIFPQEKEKTEFSLVIEKDPQQEDFLQGRMQGNPYPLSALASRSDSAAGERDVIMRDIKNKVCRDCELVALLEDDTAMELLVAGKIMSLDLPVKSVYKRIWLKDNPEGSPMRVMYRLRGLMGDATEEFIENVDSRSQNNADPEDVYRLASILADGGGFPIVMSHLTDLSTASVPEQAGPLIDVILKLLSYAVNLKVNRQAMISHAGDWKTFSTFILLLESTMLSRPKLAHQLFAIMETTFKEATSILSVDSYGEFVSHCGSRQDVVDLLKCLNAFESDSKMAEQLLLIVPFLCFCHEGKMLVLVEYFQRCLDFEHYDADPSGSDSRMLEWLCRLIEQLGQNEVAGTFKDMWLKNGMTKRVIDFFLSHSTIITSSSPESQDFKKCVGKTSMKYVLRILTGLARGHEVTQVLLSKECVPSIHRLEHVSTPLSVLAENLMEVMKENASVKERIEQIRDQTKAEKKRLAMAMRARQLGAMGMKANEKGEILITKPGVTGLDDLGDDKGHHCCICREGYKFKPEKVLGIYTFTKRQTVEELETKPTKTVGFSTVTHFTCVHVDCHMAAIKSTRDEWEKAALHNANTRCNGILPMWGPDVPETVYVQALSRYNQHIQDFTGVREVSYTSNVHDLKLALLTFAEERSFSEVSRGGGRDSNIRLIPYTIQGALYVIANQRAAVAKERTAILNFLKLRPAGWRAQCHQADSPTYYAALFVLMFDRKQWMQDRLPILQRLLVMSHEKRSINSGEPQDYSVYKGSFIFFGLIDLLYSVMFRKVTAEGEWPDNLTSYIRNNDVALMDACEAVLKTYEEELLPATSAAEILDILHLLDVITDPHAFIQSALVASFSASLESV